jgi:hypothetical protein
MGVLCRLGVSLALRWYPPPPGGLFRLLGRLLGIARKLVLPRASGWEVPEKTWAGRRSRPTNARTGADIFGRQLGSANRRLRYTRSPFQKASRCELARNAQLMALRLACITLPKPSGFGTSAIAVLTRDGPALAGSPLRACPDLRSQDLSSLIRPTSSNAVYGPTLTISATANTNSGRSNIDSAFFGQGCL